MTDIQPMKAWTIAKGVYLGLVLFAVTCAVIWYGYWLWFVDSFIYHGPPGVPK